MSEDAPNHCPDENDARHGAPQCTPGCSAYFLDLDGTLVEFAEHPQAVRIDATLHALIAALHSACAGALAVISGRPIADVDRLFHPLLLPAAGQHGAERRDATGAAHVHAADPHALDRVRDSAAGWRDAHPELVIEDKGLSLAFHFRRAPALMPAFEALIREQLAGAGDAFQVLRGKLVLEVKPSGRDKGRAIREFLAEPPFRGRTPVFIGDDATDEHGFAAVNALGGVSIKVGDGTSVACFRLAGVSAVRAWLRAAVGAGNACAHEHP